MDSQDSHKRAACIRQLGQMDIERGDCPEILFNKLEEALADPEPGVRKETVMTLAFLMKSENAFSIITPLLDDPILDVRSNTLAALSFIGVRPTSDVLEKLIADFLHAPEPEIRDRCARALGRLKIFQARSHLLELAKNDSSSSVRAAAVIGIGMMKQADSQLKSELIRLLDSETSQGVISAINETLSIIISNK
ncbi:MAG: HEAT repeat domain-containing protein [Promethearchaeota archaeon]